MSMLFPSHDRLVNNGKADDYSWTKTLEELGFRTGLYGGNIDLLAIPDLGYNIDIQNVVIDGDVDEQVFAIDFTRKARKRDPDLTLSFEDNAKGLKERDESPYSYGFDIKCYFADLEENENGIIANRKDDNIRILIQERFNFGADVDVSIDSLYNPGFGS